MAPNPQDTAEAVWAIAAAKDQASPQYLDVPEAAKVSALVKRGSVIHAAQGEWTFGSPVDAAWRLRAMNVLGAPTTAPEIGRYRQLLLSTQDQHTGGWTLSDGAAPISVTTATAAVHRLLVLPSSDAEAAQAIRRACDFLISALRNDDPRATTNYATAQIACLFGTGPLAEVRSARMARAHADAVDLVLHYVETAPGTLEEEPIRRGNVTQTWYHATLPQSVMALATARNQLIFHPRFPQCVHRTD